MAQFDGIVSRYMKTIILIVMLYDKLHYLARNIKNYDRFFDELVGMWPVGTWSTTTSSLSPEWATPFIETWAKQKWL